MMTPSTTIALTALAAFFFMAASWLMKTWAQSHLFWSMPVIFILVAAAVWLEIEVLRATRMGHVVVLMLAIELVLTFAVAYFFLGETYSVREIAGVAVILLGMIVLSSGSSDAGTATAERNTISTAGMLPKQINMPLGATLKSRQAFNTSTPGRTFPSIHSRNAPPAVEM
jgi:multidrug transporter EmrE-like cation transporter